MKKPVLVLLSTVLTLSTYAQGLVMNSGLENYITCPGFGQFGNTYINTWTKPSYGSTDYYHNNCTGIMPVNQAPHGGNAYFGIIAFNFGTEYREYATGQLSSPLVAGHEYSVEFFVSLNDNYIQAVSELGAYFSASVPGPYANSLHIPVTPQIQNTTGTLGSTTTWMTVTGSFIASGGEQYITIGNFNDDAGTTVTQVGTTGSFGAYYFVDDVIVTEIATGTKDHQPGHVSIYPNPASETLNVISYTLYGNMIATIYNVMGEEMLPKQLVNGSTHAIDVSTLSSGIYFLKIVSGNETLVQKIIKN